MLKVQTKIDIQRLFSKKYDTLELNDPYCFFISRFIFSRNKKKTMTLKSIVINFLFTKIMIFVEQHYLAACVVGICCKLLPKISYLYKIISIVLPKNKRLYLQQHPNVEKFRQVRLFLSYFRYSVNLGRLGTIYYLYYLELEEDMKNQNCIKM